MLPRAITKPLAATLAMSVALTAPSPALAADDVLVLEPASPWSLDYALDSCALRRVFGEEGRRLTLEMRQFVPGDSSIQYILASSDLRARTSGTPTNVRLRYIPDMDETRLDLVFGMSWDNGGDGVTFSSSLDGRNRLSAEEKKEIGKAELDRILLEREETITGIAVRNAFRDHVQIETGSLAKPMGAMRTCLDELLGHWGIDVEAHRTLSKPLERVNFRKWANAISNDYPEALAALGEQGMLRIRMSVSAEGEPTACNIQSQLGQDEFRERACAIMLDRAEYSPALDAQGNPIASYDILAIVYRAQ